MAEHQNSAGRLYALLSAYAARAGTMSMAAAWAATLGVAEEDLPFRLGEVARLLGDVRVAAEATDSPAFERMPDHLRTLARDIQPVGRGFDAGSTMPDARAMEMLGSLSAYLEAVEPDGRVPDDDELNALREQVRQLLSDVAAAGLPTEVKRALQHRLAEVLEALDNLHIGGPDAVARAAEALATVATLAEDVVADRTLTDRLKLFAKATLIAVQVAALMTNLGSTGTASSTTRLCLPLRSCASLNPGRASFPIPTTRLRPPSRRRRRPI